MAALVGLVDTVVVVGIQAVVERLEVDNFEPDIVLGELTFSLV